jgi:hypothetical protein
MTVENIRQNDAKTMPKESIRSLIIAGGLSVLTVGMNILPANADRIDQKPNNPIETLQIDTAGNISLRETAKKLRETTRITASKEQINQFYSKGALQIVTNKDGKREVKLNTEKLKDTVIQTSKTTSPNNRESTNSTDNATNYVENPAIRQPDSSVTTTKEKTNNSFWNENWKLITGSIAALGTVVAFAWGRKRRVDNNLNGEDIPEPSSPQNFDQYKPLESTYNIVESMQKLRLLLNENGDSNGGMVTSNTFSIDKNLNGTPITFTSNDGEIFEHGVFYNIGESDPWIDYTNGMSLLNTGDYNNVSDGYNPATNTSSELLRSQIQELVSDIKAKRYEVNILNDVVLTPIFLNELGLLYYIYAKPIITNGVITSNIITLIAKKPGVDAASAISLIPSYGNHLITEKYKESVTENFNQPERSSNLSYSAMIVELRKLALLNSYGSYLATPETRKQDDLAIITAINYLKKTVLGGGDGNKYGIDTWTGNGFAKFIPRLFRDNNKETREAQNIYSQNELNYLVPLKKNGKLESTFYGFDKKSIELAGNIKAKILEIKRLVTTYFLRLSLDRVITNSSEYNVRINSSNKSHAELVVKHAALIVNSNDGRPIL